MLRPLLSLTVIAVTALSSMAAEAAPGDKFNRRAGGLANAQQRSAVGSNPTSASGTHLVPIEHSQFNRFGCRNTRKRCLRNLFGYAGAELATAPVKTP